MSREAEGGESGTDVLVFKREINYTHRLHTNQPRRTRCVQVTASYCKLTIYVSSASTGLGYQ